MGVTINAKQVSHAGGVAAARVAGSNGRSAGHVLCMDAEDAEDVRFERF